MNNELQKTEQSVQQIISEGLEVHAPCSLAERDAQVIQVLKDVGLDPASRPMCDQGFGNL